MTEPTLLQQVLEANKSFLAGEPQYLAPEGEPFLVVACVDPRLTGLLEPALGLPKDRAVVIRTAGNQVSARNRDVLRSIAVALYVKQAREIMIVGHTDCGMAGFSVPAVVECFRQHGISRGAFGDDDLREWFGAFADIRANLLNSIEALYQSGLIPKGMKVHGLIVDSVRGSVEVLKDGDVPTPSPVPPVIEEPPNLPKSTSIQEPPEPEKTPVPPPVLKSRKGPIVVQEESPGAAAVQSAPSPDSLMEAIQVLRSFIHEERKNQQLHRFLGNLQTVWKREKSPQRILSELETVVHAYRTQYPTLPGALAYLEHAIKSGHIDRFGFGEIMRRFLD